MKRGKIFFFLFLFFNVFVFEVQAADKESKKAIVDELGRKLDSAKCMSNDCKALLEQLRTWHTKKLTQLSEIDSISILTPRDGEKVPERPVIRGKAADIGSEVWTIVHPMEVSDYWVQPRATIHQDGTWQVYIYIGRPGAIDIGKHFEIRTVVNPKSKLKEGMVLSYWPDAESKSAVVEVVRR